MESEFDKNLRNILTYENPVKLQEKIKGDLDRLKADGAKDPAAMLTPCLILSNINEFTGNIKVAAEGYRQCITLDPNSAFAHFHLGCCLYLMMDFSQSIASFERALALDSNYRMAYFWIGRAHTSLADYAHAVEAYEKLVQSHPHWTTVWFRLGRLMRSAVNWRRRCNVMNGL